MDHGKGNNMKSFILSTNTANLIALTKLATVPSHYCIIDTLYNDCSTFHIQHCNWVGLICISV